MTATPSTPTSTHYSPAAVLAAIATLLAVTGALIVASSSVKESTQAELENRVLPGNISVIGTAKVRSWQGSDFAIKLPTSWMLIADGAPRGKSCDDGNCIITHRWQAIPAGATHDASQTDCAVDAVCVELFTYPANASSIVRSGGASSPTKGTSVDVRNVAIRAFEDEKVALSSTRGVEPRFVDFGGVTAKGGRWVSRGVYRVDKSLQTSYFFATCRAGALGVSPKADKYWELRLTSREDAVPTFQFYDVLASLQTDLSSPGKGADCSATVSS